MRRVLGMVVTGLLLAGCAAPAGTPAGSISSSPSQSSAPATERPSESGEPAGTASATPMASASSEPLSWAELESEGGPSAREDHTWTVDPSDETAYLFGGRDGATVHGDLWAYDLAAGSWAEIDDGTAPPPRFGHEAVWVEDIGLVTFAGQAGPDFFNDLWAFDPDAGAWRELDATGAIPVARYGSCASLGPDGRLWISHGFTSDGTRFADTVAFDFASGTWTDETPDGDLPVSRCLHGCWWTDDGDLALYAGQTTGVTALGDRWVLADGAWRQLEGSLPAQRNLYARARVAEATVVFGGQALDAGFLADAWLMADGEADARELAVEGSAPPGRAGAELIHDPARNRLLLFGGRHADGTLADLWALTGVSADALRRR